MRVRAAAVGVIAMTLLCLTGCGGFGKLPNSTGTGGPPGSGDTTPLQVGWTLGKGQAMALPDTAPIVGTVPKVGRSTPVLINIWASWCGPCRQEMPVLQQLSESGKVVVVGVSRDATANDAKKAVRQDGTTYPIYLDSDLTYIDRYAAFDFRGVPPVTVVVIDGHVRAVHLAALTSAHSTLAYLQRLTG